MAPAAAAAAAAAAEGDDAILRNRAPSATAAAAGLARDDSGVNLAAAAADEKPPRGDVPDGDEDEDVLPDPEEEEERKKMIASFHTSIVSAKTGWQSVTPFRQVIFLYKLFFSRQFFVHRVVGLVFLLQYAAAFYLYFADYATFKASVLVFTLPGTGVFQTVTAIYTFTFLPKKAKDGGYFGDKSIMSYPFIIENSFFALILYYAYLYFDDRGRSLLQSTVLVEQVFVFFPYILRTLWPKTSFRDSYENQRNRTSKRDMFFRAAIMITKSFYVWAKHYIGYFLNYARFLDRVNNEEVRFIQQVLIFSSFSTTISIFLQTLKFKKYMGARTSFIIYFLSYMGTFYGFFNIYPIFFRNMDLTLLTFVGLAINFSKWELQWGYQIAMCILINAARVGTIDLGEFLGRPFLYVGQGVSS